ncbi:hypothetical protein RRF57_002854 [Xylaria bambusicola]|uniref:Uncharacterized protein n=1 Tax=Xylaria bambusicola TaxID=326684 RepID=A0AAN7UTG5_9PEZI
MSNPIDYPQLSLYGCTNAVPGLAVTCSKSLNSARGYSRATDNSQEMRCQIGHRALPVALGSLGRGSGDVASFVGTIVWIRRVFRPMQRDVDFSRLYPVIGILADVFLTGSSESAEV